MRDWGGDRAMLLDFGVDPRSMETMSLSQMFDMFRSLRNRRQRDRMPSRREEREAMDRFTSVVAADPSVRLEGAA